MPQAVVLLRSWLLNWSYEQKKCSICVPKYFTIACMGCTYLFTMNLFRCVLFMRSISTLVDQQGVKEKKRKRNVGVRHRRECEPVLLVLIMGVNKGYNYEIGC